MTQRPPHTVVNIRIPATLAAELRAVADAETNRFSTVVRRFICEGLAAHTRRQAQLVAMDAPRPEAG